MFLGLFVAVLGEGTLGEFRATMSLGVVLFELSPLPPLIKYCRKLFCPANRETILPHSAKLN